MLLGATVLAGAAFGAMAVTGPPIPYVDISAIIAAQTSITSALNVEPYAADIGSVGFPGVVDAAKSYFLVSNNAHATLTAAITTSDLAVTLTGDLSKFKASGALSLDYASSVMRTASSSEIVYYDGKAGQVLTLVARGQDGTTAKNWDAGSVIEARIIERHHEIHTEALIAIETEVLANKSQFQSDIGSLDARIDGHDTAITALQAVDATYDTRLDALEGGGGGGDFVRTVDVEYDARNYLAGDGVTDDTAALQAFFNQVQTNQQNATLYFDDATYIIAGALQDTSRRNAQLLLPVVINTGQQYTLKLVGRCVPACSPSGDAFPVAMPRGTILKSTLATGGGTSPAMFEGRGGVGGPYDEVGMLNVEFEKLIIQTVPNPQISALNLRRLTTCSLKDMLIVAGTGMSSFEMTEPTVTSSRGVILPDYSKGILQQITGHFNVFGFYIGMRSGELLHAHNLGFWFCKVGIEFGFTYHATQIDHLLNFWCPFGAQFTGGVHYIDVKHWATERAGAHGTGHWYADVAEIYDMSNQGSGDVTWWTVTSDVGVVNSFTMQGGANIRTRRLGAA